MFGEQLETDSLIMKICLRNTSALTEFFADSDQHVTRRFGLIILGRDVNEVADEARYPLDGLGSRGQEQPASHWNESNPVPQEII